MSYIYVALQIFHKEGLYFKNNCRNMLKEVQMVCFICPIIFLQGEIGLGSMG